MIWYGFVFVGSLVWTIMNYHRGEVGSCLSWMTGMDDRHG